MNKWIERVIIFGTGIGFGAGISWYILDKKYAAEVSDIRKEVAVDREELQKARKAYIEAGKAISSSDFVENGVSDNDITPSETRVEGPRSSEVLKDDKVPVDSNISVHVVSPRPVLTQYDKIKLPDIENLIHDDGGPNHDGYSGSVPFLGGELLPDYEIVDFDYEPPIGYDSECLEYYMVSDSLVTDEKEAEFDDILETIGHEAYHIVRAKEGCIYIAAHKHKMVYEIRSINADYVQYIYDPTEDLEKMPEELKEALKTGNYKAPTYPEANPPVDIVDAQFNAPEGSFNVFDPEYQKKIAKDLVGQKGVSMEEYEQMNPYERIKRRNGSKVEL